MSRSISRAKPALQPDGGVSHPPATALSAVPNSIVSRSTVDFDIDARSAAVIGTLPRTRSRVLLPNSVIALRVPVGCQESLRIALPDDLPLTFVRRLSDCETALRATTRVALLLTIPEAVNDDLEILVTLRKQFPTVPLVGLFVETHSDLRATAKLGSVGLTEVVSSSRLLARGDASSACTKALA